MPSLEFFRLKTREEVLALYHRFGPVSAEDLELGEAVGRVAARNLAAGEDVPAFARASMDGYAVRAGDTFGATPGLPQYLDIRGSVAMGKVPQGVVGPGEAWRIATGGMLPKGATAVVMVEYTNEMPDGTLEVRRPVAPGENILHPGEDVRARDSAFSSRPAPAPPGHRAPGGPGDRPGPGSSKAPGGGAVQRRRDCSHHQAAPPR